MSTHHPLHAVGQVGHLMGEVYVDALKSIFVGPEHHDSWEQALERWDAEHQDPNQNLGVLGPSDDRPADS